MGEATSELDFFPERCGKSRMRHLNQKRWHNQRLEGNIAKSRSGGDKELGGVENLKMVIVEDEGSTGPCELLDGGAV